MATFTITGGKRLQGSLPVYGSKNAALPLLAASLLTSEPVTFKNIPDILDMKRMLEIVQSLGTKVEYRLNSLRLQSATLHRQQISSADVGRLRGSILLLGALLGRHRQVVLPRPGGDIIGARPIDTHLDGLRQLGAIIKEEKDLVVIDGRKMKASRVILREFSVTATENVMLVSALLPGKTTILTAAAEPHVMALGKLLNRMGAKVTGAGTHTITVHGVRRLHGTTFTNIPDMLEAGFFILLAAATRSDVTIEQVPLEDLSLFLKKLDEIGINYRVDAKRRTIRIRPSHLKGFKMQSLPHPGIATDLQAPFSVVATQASGSSLIHDPLYEGRLRHINELQRMGASAVICDPHRVIINGPTALYGQTIPSLDIRSGATLLIAGLVAEGQTTIEQAEVLDRGYAELAERLRAIGANIVKLV